MIGAEPVLVFVAVKEFGKRAAVGYFATEADIPEGWTLCAEPKQDISDVLEANHWSKEQALVIMNDHWKR